MDLGDFISSGKLTSAADVQRIGKQVFEALDVLHTTARVAHGDINSFNMLFDENGNIVLSDFGSTKDLAYGMQHFRTDYRIADLTRAADVLIKLAMGKNYVPNLHGFKDDKLYRTWRIYREAKLLSWKQKRSLLALLSKIFVREQDMCPTAAEVLRDPFFTTPELFPPALYPFTRELAKTS
jgi:serine/threonine protein kinase